METSHIQPTLGEEYMAIPVAIIPPGQKLEFDLYIPNNGQFVLYAAAGSYFEIKALKKDRFNEIITLYGKRGDKAHIQYYETNLSRILRDDRIEIKARSQIYYNVATNLVKDILDDPRSGMVVKRSKEAVRNVVDMILTQKEAFFNLVRITSHDYYTYTHSVNVCTLAVGLAKRLGITTQSDYITLGLGALLHDVGKCSIGLEILNKSTTLTDAEWQELRKHPELGAKILSEPPLLNNTPPPATLQKDVLTLARSDVSLDTLRIIVQHHEACNGKGYPHNLREKEIHLFAKIVKITDIYDAMTTNRCYQKAFTPFQAIKRMQEAHAQTIDQNIFREFILLLGFGTSH